MANVTKNLVKRNLGNTVVPVNGAALQEVVFDRSDENILLHFANTDAAPCRIKIQTNGYGGRNTADLNINIAAAAEASVVLESMYFKNPADDKVSIQVLNQNDTAFSGTVTNVKFRVFEMPKSLVD